VEVEVMDYANIGRQLLELAEDWNVEVVRSQERYEVTVESRRSGSKHVYTGTDLEVLLARAHAGEPGDARPRCCDRANSLGRCWAHS
jgi:hypothetical protein